MLANQDMLEVGTQHPALCRKLTHILKNTVEAEDAAQDTYVRMLETRAEGIEIRSPNAFVNRVSHNIAIDRLRRRQRGARIFVSAEDSEQIRWQWLNAAAREHNPEQQLALSQMVNAVIGVIDELPTKCSRAYLLSCMGNHSRTEIADEIGVSVSMIEKYVRRARDHVHSNIDFKEVFDA